jgi:hypothetical protein
MLVNGMDYGSVDIGPRDLRNPFETAGASGALDTGSNTFGIGVDFSSDTTSFHVPHTRVNSTGPWSVMCLLTSGGADWTRVLHYNDAGAGFQIVNRAGAGANIGIWAGSASTWANGRKAPIADGVDAVVIATISASYVPGQIMVNGVLGTVDATAIGRGSSKTWITWGERTDGLSPYDKVSNMFAVWNRELSLTEMYSLNADPWQMSREPFPISAITATIGVVAPPGPTGRRRIIIST